MTAARALDVRAASEPRRADRAGYRDLREGHRKEGVMRLRHAIVCAVLSVPFASAIGCSSHNSGSENVSVQDPGGADLSSVQKFPTVANCARAEREGWARCH